MALVLIVWGTIGYKVATGLGQNDPVALANDLEVSFTPRAIKEPDTFSVRAFGRDPFLGTLSRANKPKTKNQKGPAKKPEQANRPTIAYQGMVKKQGSSQRIYVVNINGRQYLLRQGQSVDGVRLANGTPRNITVRYNGRSQTIALQ